MKDLLNSPTDGHNSLNTNAPDKQYFQPVDIDTANTMIGSYLNSINYKQNDIDLRSLIFDAEVLRNYLNDTGNGKIARVKLMFAHTMDHINNGSAGKNCGYKSGALTLIIAGYDASNNYVLNAQGKVLEDTMPCPTNCPTSGTAANDLLPTPRQY